MNVEGRQIHLLQALIQPGSIAKNFIIRYSLFNVDDFVFAVPEDLAKVPGLTQLRTAPAIPLIKVNTNIFRIESVGSVQKGNRRISNKKIT